MCIRDSLISLPVVDDKEVLIGEVLLNDLLELRKEGVRSIDTVIQTEVHSVLSDTVVEAVSYTHLDVYKRQAVIWGP